MSKIHYGTIKIVLRVIGLQLAINKVNISSQSQDEYVFEKARFIFRLVKFWTLFFCVFFIIVLIFVS